MGKASSSKKVARAARAGGAAQGRRHRWLFPVAIIAIFVFGVSVIVIAKGSNQKASAVSPTVGEHWHAAYGIYVCDKFIDPLTDVTADKLGIHTHGDGIMHVHPFAAGSAGKNATLKIFGDTAGLSFQSNGFTTVSNGTAYHNGYDCNGQPAEVAVYQWSADDLSAPPTIYTKDFGSIQYTSDRMVFTLAVVPPGTDVPKPPSVTTLDHLTDVPGSTPATSVVGATSNTVVPGPSVVPPTSSNSTPSSAPAPAQ